MQKFSFDLCIVSGRRPTLLQRTLKSFYDNVISNFNIQQTFINIDPFMGSEKDGLKCKEIIKYYFPSCNIMMPTEANFCLAVKHLWQSAASSHLIHLEDDWIINEALYPQDVECLFTSQIRQVSFMCTQKRGEYERAISNHRLIGRHALNVKTYKMKLITMLPKIRIRIPTFQYTGRFGTSPSIIDTPFAKQCASLLNQDYDPEKQFHKGINFELERYTKNYTAMIYVGKINKNIIRDIGREYRDKKGLVKVVKNGKSNWIER